MKEMFFSLGIALLLELLLIVVVETPTCKYNECTVESDAGLDSVTNIRGSVWEHRNGEERNSISQELLTVAVILALLLHQCMWLFSQVTNVLRDDYEAMLEGQRQPELPSFRLMQRIQAIDVCHPKLTVGKFARAVEEITRRKDLADLLRGLYRSALKESV